MQNSNTQLKIQEIQSKVTQVVSSINSLKQNKIARIYSEINNIQSIIKELQINSKTNNLEVSHISKQLQDLKQTLKQAKSVHMSDIGQQKQDILVISQHLNALQKEVSDIKVHLAQNDGQTNQCYIAIEKLQKILEKCHPTQVIQQSMQFTNAETQIKKVFYKILAGIIISIVMSILMYFGAKYWNSIIVDLYNKQVIQQNNIQQTINQNVRINQVKPTK